MEAVYEPICLEQRYRSYTGLPSRPDLLATTSSRPWSDLGEHWSKEWYMRTIGDHPIVSMWSGDHPVTGFVLQHLRELDWLSVDLVRLGTDTGLGGNPAPETLVAILLVTIASGSATDGKRLFYTAHQCKSALSLYGISDIEVEIKAAPPKATPAKAEPYISPVFVEGVAEPIPGTEYRPSGPPQLYDRSLDVFDRIALREPAGVGGMNREVLHLRHLTDSIGTSFTPSGGIFLGGTKGLLLKVMPIGPHTSEISQGIAALTCRHVVFPESSDTGGLYPQHGSPYQGHRISQETGIAITIQHWLDTLQEQQSTWGKELQEYQSQLSHTKDIIKRSLVLESLIRFGLQYIDAVNRARQVLAATGGNTSIDVGHVMFSQTLSPGLSTKVSETWLRDYALVMLDMDVHGRPPANRLPLTFDQISERFKESLGFNLSESEWEMIFKFTERSIGEEATLCGETVPADETLKPSSTEKERLVGMFGAASGLQLGFVNEAKSIIRKTRSGHDNSTSDIISWNLCVINQRRTSFSRLGDSGAVVWDLHSRVIGMITGGVGDERFGMETTYLTSIEEILGDLRRSGIIATVL